MSEPDPHRQCGDVEEQILKPPRGRSRANNAANGLTDVRKGGYPTFSGGGMDHPGSQVPAGYLKEGADGAMTGFAMGCPSLNRGAQPSSAQEGVKSKVRRQARTRRKDVPPERIKNASGSTDEVAVAWQRELGEGCTKNVLAPEALDPKAGRREACIMRDDPSLAIRAAPYSPSMNRDVVHPSPARVTRPLRFPPTQAHRDSLPGPTTTPSTPSSLGSSLLPRPIRPSLLSMQSRSSSRSERTFQGVRFDMADLQEEELEASFGGARGDEDVTRVDSQLAYRAKAAEQIVRPKSEDVLGGRYLTGQDHQSLQRGTSVAF